MTIRKLLLVLSLLGLVSACGGPNESAGVPEAQPAGASSADIGDHIVHFSAQKTDDLPVEVARAYEISRSPNNAMFSVSVLRKSDNAAVKAVFGTKAVNLTGQLKNVKIKEIVEQDAIYYVGVVEGIENMETLVFDISVTPEGAGKASEVRFKRQFFTD